MRGSDTDLMFTSSSWYVWSGFVSVIHRINMSGNVTDTSMLLTQTVYESLRSEIVRPCVIGMNEGSLLT